MSNAKSKKKIESGKKYRTRDGDEVRLFTTKAGCEDYPVVGERNFKGDWVVCTWTYDGSRFSHQGSKSDLVEVDPYDHIKVGDPVLCWTNCPEDSKEEARVRFFCGVFGGRAMACETLDGIESERYWIEYDFCELYTGLKDD